MRAVVIAAAEHPDVRPLSERVPAPMLPLVDRPFLQHVLETLAVQGVKHVDLVLSHAPERIEAHVGDGARWGLEVRHHLARDPARPYRIAAMAVADATDPVLLVHADRLPRAPIGESRPLDPSAGPVLFLDAADGPGHPAWTGWAWVGPDTLSRFREGFDEAALEAALRREAGASGSTIALKDPTLDVRSFEGILRSHRLALAGQGAPLLLNGRQAEPGIWLARNVSLHPTARLTAPVYLGENVRIGPGARLGPDAVVGADCILDRRCHLERAVIHPGSYVGEGLELIDVLVDRNRLVNVRVGASVQVSEEFLLAGLKEKVIRRGLAALGARVAGAALLTLGAPAIGAIALWLRLSRKGPVLHRTDVLRLPAPADEPGWRTFPTWSFLPPAALPGNESAWRHFLGRFLPGLLQVAAGRMRLVGVEPRAPEAVRALPSDWRSLVLRGKPGLVTEAFLTCGPNPSPDDQYAAESYYLATAGIRRDARLLLAYAGRLLHVVPARAWVRDADVGTVVPAARTTEPVAEVAPEAVQRAG